MYFLLNGPQQDAVFGRVKDQTLIKKTWGLSERKGDGGGGVTFCDTMFALHPCFKWGSCEALAKKGYYMY